MPSPITLLRESFPEISMLRHALRRLSKAPGFSFVVLLSLVLCLGPNVAIFSALYALVIKPLPFPNAERLYVVLNVAERSGGQLVQSSTTQFQDFRQHADQFSDFCTLRKDSAVLDEGSLGRRVEIQKVSAHFFDVLGQVPKEGRFFRAEEESAGRDRVLVVSERFWRQAFQADPQIVGRTVNLGGQSYQIVGVAPKALESLSKEVAFFQPYAPAASRFDIQTRYRGDLTLVACLKPGVSR